MMMMDDNIDKDITESYSLIDIILFVFILKPHVHHHHAYIPLFSTKINLDQRIEFDD